MHAISFDSVGLDSLTKRKVKAGEWRCLKGDVLLLSFQWGHLSSGLQNTESRFSTVLRCTFRYDFIHLVVGWLAFYNPHARRRPTWSLFSIISLPQILSWVRAHPVISDSFSTLHIFYVRPQCLPLSFHENMKRLPCAVWIRFVICFAS